MARLIFIANISIDGYTEDPDGRFDWTDPNDEVFAFITDLVRATRTHLYGRRMYAAMMLWETDPKLAAASPLMSAFADVWQAAEKIVYSTALQAVPTRKTRLARTFDPQAVRQLKADSRHDILIGGPELTAHAMRAGLVDEFQLFVHPILVGGGKPALPDNLRLNLELLEERRFGNGIVYLRYQIQPANAA